MTHTDDKTVLGLPTDMGTDKTIIGQTTDMGTDKTIIGRPADLGMDKTIIGQPSARETDNTFLKDDSATVTTVVQRMPEKESAGEEALGNDFLLRGRIHKNIRCLSESSGEAQVYLVSIDGHERVLKLYYPNQRPDKELLKVVRNMGTELTVNVIDIGKTYVEGRQRYYELMEYMEGGTLAQYQIAGDQRMLARLALMGAGALEYCHRYGIVHKDVKPGNFFFRDKDRQMMALGDFGISTLLKPGQTSFKSTQARTPAFAAPEMYTEVIDGIVEITPAIDFYSLGITLLMVWLGHDPFAGNERDMMRMKSEGRLPNIDALPVRVKMLVQGLTAVNPKTRWGYDEVERWFKGEDVEVDLSSPLLKYKTFVVDPDRNMVAANVKELVPMLRDQVKLASYYLYNGDIVKWLDACGNTKLSAQISDIVKNKYPADQKAGLMASLYTMDEKMPYTDIHGTQCDSAHDVALAILRYHREYAYALRNANDDLWVYLDVRTNCQVERLRGYFSSINSDEEARIAILRTVHEVDPEIPLIADKPSSTLSDIVHTFGYETCSDDEWQSLTDGRLLSWLHSHQELMASETVEILTKDVGLHPEKQRSIAYKVLYNLDKTSAFDLREADTPQKIGELLCEQLKSCQRMNDEEFTAAMDDYVSLEGRLLYYAQLHGWRPVVERSRATLDLSSRDNHERLGAYDVKTAAYRLCAQLGVTPTYLLTENKVLDDARHIPKQDLRLVRDEMRNGSLCQWISVFYHENPDNDFAEAYSYERTLEEYLMRLGELDTANVYYKRFIQAKDETNKHTHQTRNSLGLATARKRVWRLGFFGLVLFWLALLLFMGISHPPFLLYYMNMTIVLPLGTCLAVTVFTRAYFDGYGVGISLVFSLMGYVIALAVAWLLRLCEHFMPGSLPYAMMAVSVIFAAVAWATDTSSKQVIDNATLSELLDDDINSTLLEPLYYTFKTRSFKYRSTKFGQLEKIRMEFGAQVSQSIIHYKLWCLTFAVVIIELLVFSPKALDVRKPNFEGMKQQLQEIVSDIKGI